MVNFLVDTGASFTIIHLAQVASLLDQVPEEHELAQVGGCAEDASGNPLMGIAYPVTIELAPGCSYEEPEAWFCPNVAWSLLGARNFFSGHGFVVWNWPGAMKQFRIFQRRRY
jgi:hypothetical protein